MKLRVSYILYYIVISFLFYGCAKLEQNRVKSMEIDCSECKVKMQLDDVKNHHIVDVDNL